MGDGRRLTADRYYGVLDTRLSNLEVALEHIADNNPSEEELIEWILETTNALNQSGVERRLRFLETIDLLEKISGHYSPTTRAEEFLQSGDTRVIFEGLQENVKGFKQLLNALLERPLSQEEFREVLAQNEEFEGGVGVATRHREWLQMLGFITPAGDDRYQLTNRGYELANKIVSGEDDSDFKRPDNPPTKFDSSDSSWCDAIRKEIIRYCDHNETPNFDLQGFLDFSEESLTSKFPKNDTIEASTRRTLQELRDNSEIKSLGEGRYRRKALNFTNKSVNLPTPHSTLSHRLQYAIAHYGEAKSENNWNHPAVVLINSELPEEFQSQLDHDNIDPHGIQPKYLHIRGSSGNDRMSNIPWIGVFDDRVADNLQGGLYIVYLFDTAENRLFLTLNQGMTVLEDNYGLDKAKKILSRRAEILRTQINLEGFEMEAINLSSSLLTGRNQNYGDSTICYRYYDAGQFPGEDEFLVDLSKLIVTYQDLVDTGYYDSLLAAFDHENIVQQDPDSTHVEKGSAEYEANREDRKKMNTTPTVWIEKTQTRNRPYKQEGKYRLGKALTSPSRDQGGRKRYETIRESQVGDIVIHLLQDQHQFTSISVIDSELYEDFEGPPDDRWTGEQQEQGGYLRWLREYEGIEPQIHVYDDFLEKPEYQEQLREIREDSEKIFYNKHLSLNQGHYFTQCPDQLVEILAEESPYLAELLRKRGYEFESSVGLPPADTYEGIKEATEDIQTRLKQTEEVATWPTADIARSIVRDWTDAIRQANLIEGDISSSSRIRCEQIVQFYEDNADQLKEIAESIKSGTLENSDLTAGQVVFVTSLRGLQKESSITPNFNHVKFRQLLRGVHNEQGGDKLVAPDEQPKDSKTIERQLRNTGQLVFYGPPGTGKTYTAQRFARWWLNQQPGYTPSSNQLEIVTFHPSFSYEDFLEGLTAEADDGTVEYKIKDGVFKRICKRAKRAYHHAQQNEDVEEPPRFVLIIDEINRGNLAQIFGETITLLEVNKRLGEEDEVEITLAHSGESFSVPPNLYVIGTMNTADRSIALVDAALRRRFRFVSFPPNYTALIDYYDEFEDLEVVRETARVEPDPYRSLVALSILGLRELNDQIIDTPDLGKGKQIGHSYLMGLEDVSDVLDAWKYEILPLLEEYYFGQFDRIREELFRGSGDRLFHWKMEEIADFTADDLRRTLANLDGISLAEPETETKKDTQNTLNLLLDEKLVEAGDQLVFDESKVPTETDQPYDSSERFWQCEVTGKIGQSDGVKWLYNDEEYSFSGLAQTILEQISEHTGAVTGPDYWRHPGFDDRRLVDLRTEIQTGELAFEEQATE